MRIAILGTKGIPGRHGVEVVVDSLAPQLAALGYDVTVYGYSSYSDPGDICPGVRTVTVGGSSNKNLEMISHMWNASVHAKQHRYDIVHIHSADPCLLAWLPRPRCGVVATSHGQAYLRKKWSGPARLMSQIAERFFIHLPDVVTSVSRPLADYYREKYGREVHYVPNGITLREKPDPIHLRKWNIEPMKYLFCSSGRVERTKGIDTLLDAYRALQLDAPLIIAGGGSGSDFEYLEKLKQDLPSGVKFVGFLGGDELYALYAHAGVFVFPSEYEAMSMALLEGLSFGVPSVYSSIPENEAVAKGLGYSFSVSDAGSLADVLAHVLNHYGEARERGRNAMETLKKNHDWGAIAKQYHQIYTSLSGA